MPATYSVKPVTAEWSIKRGAEKTTGQTVHIVTASEPVTPLDVLSAEGLPQIGTQYTGASFNLRCNEIDPRPSDGTRMNFKVVADFDSTFTLDPNPLLDPLKVSYGKENAEEAYYKDVDDNPAQTTAGEPFAELPKRRKSDLVLNLSINVSASTNYSAYEDIRETVNEEIITIDGRSYAPGTLLAEAPELSEVQERNGTEYRVLSSTLVARKEGWNQKFESRGLYELVGGVLERIYDDKGNPIESAWPLDADGAAQASASTPGAEIERKPYAEADHSILI
jgi:hypothetical protein